MDAIKGTSNIYATSVEITVFMTKKCAQFVFNGANKTTYLFKETKKTNSPIS